METTGNILVAISGIAWTIVYLELIHTGFRQKACGMPLFALTLNLAWEVIYAVDGLFVSKSFIFVQSVANVVWACCDIFILVTWFRYGKQYLPDKAKKYFIPYSVIARDFAFKEESFPFYLQFTRKNRKDPYGIKSYSFFMYKQSKRTPFPV